jgi:hypothetical protein
VSKDFVAWGASVDTPLLQGYPRFELPGKQTGAGFSPTSMNVLVVCLSRSGEMKAQQLDVRFAPFQTFIVYGKLGQQVCLGLLAHLGSLAVSGLGSCGVRKVEP